MLLMQMPWLNKPEARSIQKQQKNKYFSIFVGLKRPLA